MVRVSVPAEVAARRLRLLRAAFREVAERGIAHLTLDDIARRAGVSKGVTLYYFQSKDRLLRELFRWLIASIHARMRESVSLHSDPVAMLRVLIETTFPSAERNRRFFRAYIDFSGLGARDESFRRISAEFYAGCRTIDRHIVEEGMRAGVFRPRDAEEAASTLRAIFDGLLLQWLAEKEPETTFPLYRSRCEREILRYLAG